MARLQTVLTYVNTVLLDWVPYLDEYRLVYLSMRDNLRGLHIVFH